MCPILARVRAMLVGTDATFLVASCMVGRILPSWFISCRAWISAMESHADDLVDQLAYYRNSKDLDAFILFSCISVVMLAELDRILKRHPFPPYNLIQPECRIKCAEVLNKITRTTEGMLDRDDLTFMALLFQNFCFTAAAEGEPTKSSSTDIAVRWPRLKPSSIFHNTTLTLMGLFQKKVASFHIKPHLI